MALGRFSQPDFSFQRQALVQELADDFKFYLNKRGGPQRLLANCVTGLQPSCFGDSPLGLYLTLDARVAQPCHRGGARSRGSTSRQQLQVAYRLAGSAIRSKWSLWMALWIRGVVLPFSQNSGTEHKIRVTESHAFHHHGLKSVPGKCKQLLVRLSYKSVRQESNFSY